MAGGKEGGRGLALVIDGASCRATPLDWPVQRSRRVVISGSMVSAGIPGYSVRICTAGVRNVGRMSVGIRLTATAPRRMTVRAPMTTRYGFLRDPLTKIVLLTTPSGKRKR